VFVKSVTRACRAGSGDDLDAAAVLLRLRRLIAGCNFVIEAASLTARRCCWRASAPLHAEAQAVRWALEVMVWRTQDTARPPLYALLCIRKLLDTCRYGIPVCQLNAAVDLALRTKLSGCVRALKRALPAPLCLCKPGSPGEGTSVAPARPGTQAAPGGATQHARVHVMRCCRPSRAVLHTAARTGKH